MACCLLCCGHILRSLSGDASTSPCLWPSLTFCLWLSVSLSLCLSLYLFLCLFVSYCLALSRCVPPTILFKAVPVFWHINDTFSMHTDQYEKPQNNYIDGFLVNNSYYIANHTKTNYYANRTQLNNSRMYPGQSTKVICAPNERWASRPAQPPNGGRMKPGQKGHRINCPSQSIWSAQRWLLKEDLSSVFALHCSFAARSSSSWLVRADTLVLVYTKDV